MRKSHVVLGIICLTGLVLFFSCSPAKYIENNEYMLMKNSIKMEDTKGQDFDDLVYLLRPETNKKFAGIFNLKAWIYANNLPKTLKNGTVKDSRWRRWWRQSAGEPPVLLDSSAIENSVEQVSMAMRQMGYFDAKVVPEVVVAHKNKHKAKVVYHVTAGTPYFIRDLQYKVSVPEYRKIIIPDTIHSLIRKNSRYNENTLSAERTRLTNLLKDHGYYHVGSEVVVIEIDTFNASLLRDAKNHKTLAIRVLVSLDEIANAREKEKALYKYSFNNVYIYSNHDPAADLNQEMDTVIFRTYRNKRDSTLYYFITPHWLSSKHKQGKIYRDFKYRTLTDVLYTKRGWLYSQDSYTHTYNRLNELGNFNIINIEYIENSEDIDTIRKTGTLDTRYRLTRNKLHAFSSEWDIRSDKSSLSLTYTNRNIFKGAEHFNVNVFGSYYYYNLLFNKENPTSYGELGGNITIDFPRLFIFKQTQKIEALRYQTTIKAGGNYNWYFKRLLLNAGLTYSWAPNANLSHQVTPISIGTIDTSRSRVRMMENYPQSYKQRFTKRILIAFNYSMNYLVPFADTRHNMLLSLACESSGFAIWGMNAIDNKLKNKNNVWRIAGYNYATYELTELNWRYYFLINHNHSIAARINAGVAIPFFDFKHNTIPFERSFYVGGPNSMRAWSFRSLGPGSFHPENEQYIERTGDIKLEINMEYRGTIYKSFKFGIFVDAGNVWLSRPYEDMDGANFQLNKFYKDIAIGIGAGLRLDFNFFLIRVDYGIPIHDPSATGSSWINKDWTNNGSWRPAQGFQFAIGHAF
ncbi:MAG: BamA/TamA family outer membrane protein [Bacteroidales bacterium]|nr:BamA/TamA family outer membrane protein [Bacteroidales bacterium]